MHWQLRQLWVKQLRPPRAHHRQQKQVQPLEPVHPLPAVHAPPVLRMLPLQRQHPH